MTTIPAMYTPTTGPAIDKQFFVFAYSMSERDRLYEMDRQSIEFDGFRHVVGYYDCPVAANYDVTLLINTDEVDFDLCWSVGKIPLCNDTHYQH
jgi:hypothetical protein